MATEPLHPTRVCRKCGVEKPHARDHFVTKLGKLTPLCRECNAADCKMRYEANRSERQRENRERWHANRDAYRESQRRYYRDHIDERKAADKAYRDANKERRQRAHREWAKANPEAIARYCRNYSNTPEGKASQRRRNARHRELHAERLRARRKELYDPKKAKEYERRWLQKDPERKKVLRRAWYRANKLKVKEWDHKRRAANNSGIVFTAADVERTLVEQGHCCTYCEVNLRQGYEVDHFIPVAKGGGHEPSNIVAACMPCNRSKGAKLPWVWRPDLFRPPI